MSATFHQLLNHLHRGGEAAYLWYLEGKHSDWFRVGEALPLLDTGKNTYFGVHPTAAAKSAHQRATIADIVAVNCLIAEFDAKDFEGGKAAARAHVEALNPAPSVIIDSGGGYQCYWLFRRTFHIQREEDRAYISGVQARWVTRVGGDPSAKDLARVLRVVGAFNRKPHYGPDFPRVQFIKADFALLYDHNNLAALAPPAEVPAPIMTRETPPRHANPARLEAYVLAALDNEMDTLAQMNQGGRNAALFKYGASLGGLLAASWVEPSWLTEADIERGAWNAGQQNGMIRDDGEGAFRATLASGLKAGKANPRAEPPEKELRQTEEKTATRFEERFKAEAEAVAVMVGNRKVDAATGLIYEDEDTDERYQQLQLKLAEYERTLAHIERTITAPKADGWTPSAKLADIHLQLELFRRGDKAVLARGATELAETIGVSVPTATDVLKKLCEAELAEWLPQEREAYDPKTGAAVAAREARGRDDVKYRTLSVVVPLPAPSGPRPVLERTEYNKKQKSKADQARDRIKMAEAILTKANCLGCGKEGGLDVYCRHCDAKFHAEHPAVRNAFEWQDLPELEILTDPEPIRVEGAKERELEILITSTEGDELFWGASAPIPDPKSSSLYKGTQKVNASQPALYPPPAPPPWDDDCFRVAS
jgi:hypothetical protein